MTKISVIMPSYLNEYEGCAPDRKVKFVRAVDSFIKQTHKEKELVVISDGCQTTTNILAQRYLSLIRDERIRVVELPRHELFTGAVRQAGIDVATGKILCNLDTDDTITPNHLHNISVSFNPDKYEWAYFGHITAPDNLKDVEYFTDVVPELGRIGNGNIAWRTELDVTWNNCDGIHDNQLFIKQLIEKYPNPKKLYGCGYCIRHLHLKKN